MTIELRKRYGALVLLAAAFVGYFVALVRLPPAAFGAREAVMLCCVVIIAGCVGYLMRGRS